MFENTILKVSYFHDYKMLKFKNIKNNFKGVLSYLKSPRPSLGFLFLTWKLFNISLKICKLWYLKIEVFKYQTMSLRRHLIKKIAFITHKVFKVTNLSIYLNWSNQQCHVILLIYLYILLTRNLEGALTQKNIEEKS